MDQEIYFTPSSRDPNVTYAITFAHDHYVCDCPGNRHHGHCKHADPLNELLGDAEMSRFEHAFAEGRRFVIRLDESDGEMLYWSNNDGWVDFGSATYFTAVEMKNAVYFPIIGRGQIVSWEERHAPQA